MQSALCDTARQLPRRRRLGFYNVPIVVAIVLVVVVIVRRLWSGWRCLLEGGIEYVS
jgi:hypothetical protein